jgi:hypothetical protein
MICSPIFPIFNNFIINYQKQTFLNILRIIFLHWLRTMVVISYNYTQRKEPRIITHAELQPTQRQGGPYVWIHPINESKK